MHFTRHRLTWSSSAAYYLYSTPNPQDLMSRIHRKAQHTPPPLCNMNALIFEDGCFITQEVSELPALSLKIKPGIPLPTSVRAKNEHMLCRP